MILIIPFACIFLMRLLIHKDIEPLRIQRKTTGTREEVDAFSPG